MERSERSENRQATIHGVGSTMSAFDRARAVQGMNEAMMLAKLAIKTSDHVRGLLTAWLNTAGRGVVLR